MTMSFPIILCICHFGFSQLQKIKYEFGSVSNGNPPNTKFHDNPSAVFRDMRQNMEFVGPPISAKRRDRPGRALELFFSSTLKREEHVISLINCLPPKLQVELVSYRSLSKCTM